MCLVGSYLDIMVASNTLAGKPFRRSWNTKRDYTPKNDATSPHGLLNQLTYMMRNKEKVMGEINTVSEGCQSGTQIPIPILELCTVLCPHSISFSPASPIVWPGRGPQLRLGDSIK